MLFDDETFTKNHDAQLRRESKAEGIKEERARAFKEKVILLREVGLNDEEVAEKLHTTSDEIRAVL